MRFPGIMHVQADLLNCIGDIWPGEGEVQKSSSKTAVLAGIRNRGTISRELRVSIHRSAARLAVTHTSSLQNLQHILALREKKAVTSALNADTQKMVKRPHVCHRKFLAECCDNPVKKTRRGRSENNVINI
jgi:hypothetical protein